MTEVHPVADLFPMLADDELRELAEDIKRRGQLQPIVLDVEGRVLDGRNRLAACELAGVEPRFETYDGDDPDGYALAVNGQRRAQTKGQKALVAAAYLNDLSRKKTQRAVAQSLGVTEALVSQAVLIWGYAREQSAAVMVTGVGFADALRTATDRKREAEEARAKLERLRLGAPDLAEHVDEDRMSLDDAIAALDAREEKARKAEREAQERSARLASLPTDLAARVESGDLGFTEAESIVQQRKERLKAWVEKIRIGLETLTRMAGNPIPADLKEHLSDEEIANLGVIVAALENGESK